MSKSFVVWRYSNFPDNHHHFKGCSALHKHTHTREREMARNLDLSEDAEAEEVEEEYIDMEVSSFSTYLCYSMISSPPHSSSKEFEFQMSSSISLNKEPPTTSPADELFYKGTLLPLHLPPRLQMLQNLLLHNNSSPNTTTHHNKTQPFEQNNPTTAIIAPFESSNISPSGPCMVTKEKELNPDENIFDCSTEVRSFIKDNNHPKKSWSKKLKFIKKSSLGIKLKTLFTKLGSSDQVCTKAVRNGDEESEWNANKSMKVAKKNPFEKIERERYKIPSMIDNCASISSHRKSFSWAMKKNLATKSSSLSSSSSSVSSGGNSNGFYEINLLKRSNSVNSEIENSIHGAIAHCKESQKLFCPRKSVSEVGFCSLSASRIAACENQERPGLCRGW